MNAEEEGRCIAECLAGNPEGFRPLVEAYQAQIVGTVIKMTGRPDIADEIAQEAFVRAYTKLHTFRKDSRFGTWVTTIAIRLCHDLHRMERHWAPAPTDATYGDGHMGSEELLANAERDSAIASAIQNLPPHYREVLVLRYCEGHSLNEIAQILDKGLSAVKMTNQRGVEMLRRELAKRGVV